MVGTAAPVPGLPFPESPVGVDVFLPARRTGDGCDDTAKVVAALWAPETVRARFFRASDRLPGCAFAVWDYEPPALPDGRPAWVTRLLMARTHAVFGPRYAEPLSPDAALAIILSAAALADA
jgi:hypothetical protein